MATSSTQGGAAADPGLIYVAPSEQENRTSRWLFRTDRIVVSKEPHPAESWLLSFGFEEREAKGSHKVFTHPQWNGRLTMQSHKGKAKPYQIKQALDAVKEIHNV